MKHRYPYKTSMIEADTLFKQVWGDFIIHLNKLRKGPPKRTLESLGKACGVKKGTISRWLEGTGGERTAFADMLRYMQAVGMDIQGFAPMPIEERLAKKQSEILKLKAELERTKSELSNTRNELEKYKAKWEAYLEIVRAQTPPGPPRDDISKAG